MEALDLALGLGVAGRAVLLTDAQQRQQVFKGVAATAEPGGVDAPVVSQRAGRDSVLVGGGQERGDDVLAADGLVHRR